MIRAALKLLVTAAVLTVASAAFAQTDIYEASNEAVRRQAHTVELRQQLAEAAQAEAKKDLPLASQKYQTAYKTCVEVGTGVDRELKTAVDGITRVNTQLANLAMSRGNYVDAAPLITSALRVDPKNSILLALKKTNDAAITAHAGQAPRPEVLAKAGEIYTNNVEVATLVQEGRFFYENGKLDEAQAKLDKARELDPLNQPASYYQSLVVEARYKALNMNRDVIEKNQLLSIEEAWQPNVKRDLLPKPNPMANTNLIHTSSARQAIASKLDRILMSDVKYDGLELGEVIRNLSDESRKRDPDKTGINFLILSEAPSSAPAAPGAVDPTTGLPATSVPTEAVDLSTVRVKIGTPLNNLRLVDVLDAIVKTAEKPIKYSIEDYAIVFSLKSPEPTPLYTRTFNVDPNTFVQGLESVNSSSFGAFSSGGSGGGGSSGGQGGQGGQGGASVGSVAFVEVAGGGVGRGNGSAGISFVTRTNTTEVVQVLVKNFFTVAGVDLTPPKAVFFNDRKGILFVRASLADLDLIEAAVNTLNVTPPQIHLQAKFAEVSQTDQKALGFQWYLGNTLAANGNIGLQGGTAPSYSGAPSSANPAQLTLPDGTTVSSFPGNAVYGTSLLPSTTDQLLTGGLRNVLGAPALGTLTGILTDPQFRTVVNALEQRDGVDLLNAPEVTTVSGRQCHIEVTDLISVVTGVDAQQTGSGGSSNNSGNSGSGSVGSTITFTVETLPFGPALDVVPYVSADGYTIQMTIIPTLTEFLGYDTSSDSSKFVVQAQGSQGGTLTQVLPLPLSRVRQVTTTCVVWDGQTVVLGGLITENTVKTKDKVPVLGDLPMVGRLFRSESSFRKKKNLLIFVTPTIIDPAGNRTHTDEDMPFAKSTVPPQPNARKLN